MIRYFFIQIFCVIISFADAQSTGFKNLTPQDFTYQIHNNPGTLLDVRTSTEFANGHIANAGQLNYYALDFEQKLLLLPKNHPIYLYCSTGYRSKRAAQMLVKNGYSKVFNLEKGIMDWNLNNLPIVADPNANTVDQNTLSTEEFYTLTKTHDIIFFDFYAPWCAPCRSMMPLIDSLETVYKNDIKIVKINVDASKKLVKELGLSSVPYFALYSANKKVFEHHGMLEIQKLDALFKQTH